MKKTAIMAIMCLTIFTGCSKNKGDVIQNSYSIIPAPASLVILDGYFTINEETGIIVTPLGKETSLSAEFLAGLLRASTSFQIPVTEGIKENNGDIFIGIDTTLDLGTEGYNLAVTKKKVVLTAPSSAGLFHGVQTIRQLLPPQVEVPGGLAADVRATIPACIIKDQPRFSYRGLHLDVCRHIFTVEAIKKYIDILALHKMNTFHWHLTDDQGWRIEIKKYPELTRIGSQRKETLIGHGGRPPFKYDGQPYGGFYTQEQVKEIVKYASDRFITVIPEIEMPGHAQAALAAYPVFSCTGKPVEVVTRWGVFEEVFCAGKDTTFAFLEDVLAEVIELFPSEYIHIGGDECPKERWEKCPACQKRIKDEGLKNEMELQSYLVKRIETYLNSKGKKIIGWDEILEGGLAPEATVMSWRGTEGGIAAAKQGHDVIMTPVSHLYLDYYQSEPEGEPLGIGGYSPLEWVYSFDPLPEDLTSEEQKYILGLQGNVWTEYIPSLEHLEHMAFPRAFAIAETGWTPELKKDFEDFMARFAVLRTRYDLMGINYFKGEYRNTRGKKE